MVQAMVAVLPEPVIPSRVWNRSPRSTPSTSPAMAWGWSPAGRKGETTSKGGTTAMVPADGRRGSAEEVVDVTPDPISRRSGAVASATRRRSARSSPQTRSTSWCRWSTSPELSITKSAPSRRSARSGWAAIRARASSSDMPRCPTSRSRASSGGASTTTTAASDSSSRWATLSRGMSMTTMRSLPAWASFCSIIATPMAGWTIALRSASSSGWPKTIAASAGRSIRPSGSRTPGPNRSTSCRWAGAPGSTTSRATWSASTTTAPWSTSSRATVDLPAPMFPVRPTASTAGPPAQPARRGRDAVANRTMVVSSSSSVTKKSSAVIPVDPPESPRAMSL